MKRKALFIPAAVILILLAGYLAGPRMPRPTFSAELPESPVTAELAAQMIHAAEAGITNVRPGNTSFISWADDSLRQKTPWALLYLHGFSASPREGDPVNRHVGAAFGMNVYVPRLAEHGLDTPDALLNMTPDRLWESALDALSKARALGDQVVIMGTSTGGTLALKLAAEYPDQVDALVLCSPNVRIFDKTAALLSKPWGLQIGRMVMGGDYRELEPDPQTDPFWYSRYRVEALVYLQQLIDATMKARVFNQVQQPVYLAYYYRDADNQDQTVSVEAMHWMFDNLGTEQALKKSEAFPDAGAHVICCDLTSDSWQEVEAGITRFLKETVIHHP